MENLFEHVKDSKNGFQRLVEKIPGIKGYKDKEDRRDTDKLVRELIAKRFEEQWQRISSIQNELVRKGNLKAVGELETGSLRVRQFIDRVRTASYGYAGMFDEFKVDEDALIRLYDYDLYLLSLNDILRTAIDAIDTAVYGEGDLSGAISHLSQVAQDCIMAFNRRSDVITGTQNQ